MPSEAGWWTEGVVNLHVTKMSHKIIISGTINSEKSAFYLCHLEHTPMTSVTEASILALDCVSF
jgi:hypothetical protein